MGKRIVWGISFNANVVSSLPYTLMMKQVDTGMVQTAVGQPVELGGAY